MANLNDGLTTLLQDMMDVLREIRDDEGNTIFKYVTIFRDQFQRFGNNDATGKNDNLPFQWPVAFIEPLIDDIDTGPHGIQYSNVTLNVFIGLWRFDLEKEDNWKFPFQLRVYAHRYLQTLKDKAGYYSSLMRSPEFQDNSYENFYVWQMQYHCQVYDETAIWGQDGIPWNFDSYKIIKNIE